MSTAQGIARTGRFTKERTKVIISAENSHSLRRKKQLRGSSRARRRKNRIVLIFALFLLSAVLSPFLSIQFPASARDDSPSPSAWSVSVVDPEGFWTPSIAVDSAGRPHIAYFAETNELRYASWTGSSWQFEKVDSWSIMGEKASLALDSNDNPHIAYYDWDARDLKYAYKNDSTWIIEVVDEDGDVGRNPSLAIDSHNRPHVSYYNITDMIMRCDLKYAVRDGNSWHTASVAGCDFYDYSESETSLKLNAADEPRIAYAAFQILYYASWTGSTWQVEAVPKDPGDTGDFPSLALDSRGDPHIAYLREWDVDRLDYATKGPMGWVTQTVDAGRGYSHAIAIDSQDRPHIAYTTGLYNINPPWYLYYAHLDGSWFLETVDTHEYVRSPPSIAIDGCDGVHIAYTRNYSGGNELRYAYLPGQDLTAPKSRASSPGRYWRNSPATVEAIASDSCSGALNVTLWYRQSTDNATTWGAWTPFSTLVSAPWTWSFTFPAGEGYYEFYTTSFDILGNAEPPPPTADAIAGYDITPPVSTALPISPYWHTSPPVLVNATATDNLSGVAEVTLLHSYAPLDNSSWSPWTPFGTETAEPWSWSFPFPDGEGNYMFHTIARDVAGNVEGSKDYAEAIAGYRVPPDYTPVNTLPVPPITVGLSLPVQLSIDVMNSGGFDNVTSTLAFYDESSPSSPFSAVQVPPTPAGSVSGPFAATWTSPATPCACRVVAHVDFFDNLTESNETNNAYTWIINVVPGPITSLAFGQPNHTAAATYITSHTPVILTATDQSGTGIKSTRFRTDNGTWNDYASSFFFSGDGDHCVEWYSEDNAGNVEGVNGRAFSVDDTPPLTTLSVGQPEYLVGGRFVNSSTPLTLGVNDGGVGRNSTLYRLWGDSWSWWREYTTPFTLVGRDGTWFVEFLSYDYLGNRETASNATLVLDDTPPSTTLSPATDPYTIDTVFTLPATDAGSGVNVTKYRIDGGIWTTYSGGFKLAEGTHNISYLSVDNLNNTERERWRVVNVQGAPPSPEVVANYKPVVASIFAIILLVAGVLSSKRRPWKGGKDSRAAVKAFATTSLPFVLAESVTGVASFFTGELRIPPAIGVGTAVDLAILLTGLLIAVLRTMKDRPVSNGTDRKEASR